VYYGLLYCSMALIVDQALVQELNVDLFIGFSTKALDFLCGGGEVSGAMTEFV
jgi:hypothetical protein